MNNIVLLNPPISQQRVYGQAAAFGSVGAPTGLCYLAAQLRLLGYTPSIVDAEALNLDIAGAAAAILAQKPDLLGITCKTLWVKSAAAVARLVKDALPNLPIVVGGNHVTALPLGTLQEFPQFDYCVVGEGEETLPDLIQALRYGDDLWKVDGIAYRNLDGVPVRSPLRQRLKNLDRLPPPAYDLLPELMSHYWPLFCNVDRYPAFSVFISRGCHGQCRFCDRSTFGNEVTRHSPEYVVRMLRNLRDEHNIRYIVFDDDNFTTNRAYLLDLLRHMVKSKVHLPFSCLSRVDTVDPALLKDLRRAGCRRIMYGIESGSQRMLDAMNKGITLDQVRTAIAATKAVGIKTYGYIMLGFPGETECSMAETVAFVRELKLFDVGCQPFVPPVGSAIYQNIHSHGTFTEDWDTLGAAGEVPFVAHGLSRALILDYVDQCYRACYNRAYQYLTLHRRIRSLRQLKLVLKYLFGKKEVLRLRKPTT